MRKIYFRILSIFCLLIGILLMIYSETGITSAVVRTNTFVNFKVSAFLIIIAICLFVTGENLEEKISIHWRKFAVNADSIIQDIDQGYLAIKEKEKRTATQSWAERHSTSGRKIISPFNKKKTYEEQFYEGHASKGGRIINAESHIEKKGKNKGKLMHFSQPANARYLWIVDEDYNFILANRQTFVHEMKTMNQEKIDYPHRLHKLPHATVAKGRKVYGSGEVLIEGGLVKEYNSSSGHYISLKDIPLFNKQGKEVFEQFMKKIGWKEVKNGAKYILKKK